MGAMRVCTDCGDAKHSWWFTRAKSTPDVCYLCCCERDTRNLKERYERKAAKLGEVALGSVEDAERRMLNDTADLVAAWREGLRPSKKSSAAAQRNVRRPVQCIVCRQKKPKKAFGSHPSRLQPKWRCICADCRSVLRQQEAEARRAKPRKRTPEQRMEERLRRAIREGRQLRPRALKLHDSHVEARERWVARGCCTGLHDAHVRRYRSDDLYSLRWARRYRNDPGFALKQRYRTANRKLAKIFPKLGDLLRAGINRNGSSGVIEAVCGYSIDEVRAHLGSKFKDGMTWEAFSAGLIHIDHIRPQASFDLNDVEQVRECWSLSNLQPLWGPDNLRKSDWHGPARGRHQKPRAGQGGGTPPPPQKVLPELQNRAGSCAPHVPTGQESRNELTQGVNSEAVNAPADG